MKHFFSDMTVERWVIVVSLVVATALGSVGYFKFYSERALLEEALTADVIQTAQGMQADAMKYSRLYKEADLQALTGSQSNAESFLRTLAASPKANLGQVDVKIAETANSVRKGVADKKFTIQPQNRDRAFQRIAIANFLFLAETESAGMRVSHLRLTLSPKNLKEWDFPPGDGDNWFWEAELLSRTKSEAAK
ncbi:MAG: hypothetical protein L6Q99_12690 [Planctomycetes bacterium]|nr:hypothetical protein [Planctomycetota bacterium]